jgi:protein phosphatase
MGGCQAGEMASILASERISQFILNKLTPGIKALPPDILITQAISNANNCIFNLSCHRKELHSMGTTIVLGFRLNNTLFLGHAGDSRAYLIREGKIIQLTEDHSLIAYLIKRGIITSNEARTHPDRGKIFRFLGASENIKVDTITLLLHPGDSLVFCSDGVISCLSDDEILRCVENHEEVSKKCRNLIDLANSRNSEDNISSIVVNIMPIEKVKKGC